MFHAHIKLVQRDCHLVMGGRAAAWWAPEFGWARWLGIFQRGASAWAHTEGRVLSPQWHMQACWMAGCTLFSLAIGGVSPGPHVRTSRVIAVARVVPVHRTCTIECDRTALLRG